MPLLSGMADFSRFFPPVDFASGAELISWYISSGATKSRLFALAQSAAILARLHAAGIVYGDLSPRNVFVRGDRSAEVWLIDCDNLKFETKKGDGLRTPAFAAPEIRDFGTRPRTDSWSFAVIAFWILSSLDPFDGQKADFANSADLPFVDDEDDDSNRAMEQGKPLGLPRELVLTPRLIRLFQAALGKGRRSPWHRPSLGYWALELARAHDLSIVCQKCRWSYGVEEPCCPLCDAAKPNHVLAESRYWKMVLQETEFVVNIPHRLIRPFSLRMTDPTEYEIEIDADRSRVVAARGSSPIPKGLDFRFVGEEK
jgi:DNA-binding helix-hairpin-helix protein with protein kinase domain